MVEESVNVSDPPETLSDLEQLRLLTLAVVVRATVEVPVAAIVTSSFTPGRIFPLQFAAALQETPSPAPVQLTLAAVAFDAGRVKRTSTSSKNGRAKALVTVGILVFIDYILRFGCTKVLRKRRTPIYNPIKHFSGVVTGFCEIF